MPQWSWTGDMSRQRIREQLAQFKEQGCGGTFTHPRQGHITGYLTGKWFELWEYAAKESARLGMDMHIYDEFICPGGTAGGNITAENPTVVQQVLILCKKTNIRGEIILPITIKNNIVLKSSEEKATQFLCMIKVFPGPGGLPAPDLCRRETAEALIKTTHEKYKKTSGNRFGKNVTLMFCDEPHLNSGRNGFPFSRHIMKEFRKDHGYSLEGKALLSLCFNQKGSEKVRFDFWETILQLYNKNFMQVLYKWCSRNKLNFTGHLMENDWPYPYASQDNMASLRWMHVPGEDLLSFQFKPTKLADNSLYLMNLKELSSLVNQLARAQSMVETSGARGYHTAMEFFKPCEDFTLSFGVNVIDPHLCHESLAGCSKYDWPQTLSDHSPWWQYYHIHANHVTRVNAALSQGKEYNRVLVLMPTTTAWMHYTGREFDSNNSAHNKLEQIKASQLDLCCRLYEEQIDFDLGDEYILEEFGKVSGGEFIVGHRSYNAVIIPPAMENFKSNTVKLLKDYIKASGRIYMLNKNAVYIEGEKAENLKKLFNKKAISNTDKLITILRKETFPYISSPDGRNLPGGIVWRRVVTPEGELYFFCNPWEKRIKAKVQLEGKGLLKLDPERKDIYRVESKQEGSRSILALNLLPRGHELILVTNDKVAAAKTPVFTEENIKIQFKKAFLKEKNLLYIDYCDIKAFGRKKGDINTARADNINFQWQGFDKEPWNKQFRRTIIDKKNDPDSDLNIAYRFYIEEELPDKIKRSMTAAVERPHLYEISLNNKPIKQGTGRRWFDEDMKEFPIGNLTRKGENVLKLEAKPFHVLCEIMPVYIRGDFSLARKPKGFGIILPGEFSLGDWTRSAPFYPDAVHYQYSFNLEKSANRIKVRLLEWEGQAAAVYLNGKKEGIILHPPFSLEVCRKLPACKHELTIEIIGNMKNMMGSHHHHAELPLRWTYEYAPEHMPSGKKYHFYPTGLMKHPMLAVITQA